MKIVAVITKDDSRIGKIGKVNGKPWKCGKCGQKLSARQVVVEDDSGEQYFYGATCAGIVPSVADQLAYWRSETQRVLEDPVLSRILAVVDHPRRDEGTAADYVRWGLENLTHPGALQKVLKRALWLGQGAMAIEGTAKIAGKSARKRIMEKYAEADMPEEFLEEFAVEAGQDAAHAIRSRRPICF